jgi:HD-GYP domain-containing protein (c-di-GMP phosphodiesterase class II)
MKIAAYLHDLGKLAVPPEILNKPDGLSDIEFNTIKKHPFNTYRILERVESLEKINMWASLHHERVDGTGYPFHYKGKNLPVGSRIMAIADVFTALKEDRPYRDGMTREKTLSILEDMAKESALDSDIVLVLKQNYEEINHVRKKVQIKESRDYDSLISN